MSQARERTVPENEQSRSQNQKGSGLRIGAPSGVFEQEADRVADEIVSGRPRSGWSLSQVSFGQSVQRKCACGGSGGADGECEECKEKKEKTLQRKATGPSPTGMAPPIVHDVLKSPGQPLDRSTRDFFEPRFGRDFSHVRVHAGDAAGQSAKSIDADAYAVGNHIVFGDGRFNSATNAGRRLIAHELTHVVQQGRLPHAPSKAMRSGRTVGGFLGNIFHFWSYSEETLKKYLKVLEEQNQIERDDDSDDKARQVVEEWKGRKSHYPLNPRVKVLLVREMLNGVVSGKDQDRIMDLLEGSTSADLQRMFLLEPGHLSLNEIASGFDSDKPRLQAFNTAVLEKLGRQTPSAPGDKSVEERLNKVEQQTGISFQDLVLMFRIEEGPLKKSFLADVVVPHWGTTVTVTLNRTGLKVSFQPAIVVSVPWPLSNASVNGFTFTFAGSKRLLDIQGSELVAGKAKEEVQALISTLLAGTSFESPDYNLLRDPKLVSQALDREGLNDVSRIRYNFEALQSGSKGDSKVSDSISGFGIYLNLIYQKGRPIPTTGWDIVINPGTPFQLEVITSGSASEAKDKNLRLSRVVIRSAGEVLVYRGKQKIASLTSIEMDRGLKVTLGPIKTFVDLKEIMMEEAPGWLKGAAEVAAGGMKKYDDAVDAWHNITTLGGLLDDLGPKSDVAKDIAVSEANDRISNLIRVTLHEHWREIQEAVGVTDEQIENFLGLPASKQQIKQK